MSRFQAAVCLRAALILWSSGVATSVFGLSNRVFVSARSGNDANTCDNIPAPCQTFAGAVAKLFWSTPVWEQRSSPSTSPIRSAR